MKRKILFIGIFTFVITMTLLIINGGSNVKADPVYTAGEENVFSRNPSLPTGDLSNGADNWYKSDKVTQTKVSFKNIYGMKIVGNLFVPKGLDKTKENPAIIVGAPFGAVKEQSSNLYAQKMADKGFVTLSFDQVFYGESDGSPKGSVEHDLYSESFSAAADYLTTLNYVDNDRIGVLGICASGGFSISAAKIDSRLKAIATVSMYDLGEMARSGINNSQSIEQRKANIKAASDERTAVANGKPIQYIGGTPETITPDSDPISKEFYDFYRTQRGAAGTTTQMTQESSAKFINFYPLEDMETIAPRPLLFIAGDHAHSLSFSQEAYEKASGPKELYIVKNAGHVDLYDRTDLIPFEKLDSFFSNNL
ncbi:alpha/beta hydrolase [Companilactobacillus metriopterae]|uniref:alpha/beta hydrolase n=1 Tax=Companilactobacillus metriopterae TaxID=1909267 RepID=UPI0019D6F9D0|nr:alpha/beta hydrolase [Companilactobacillus metriopterae]